LDTARDFFIVGMQEVEDRGQFGSAFPACPCHTL
jgi:hypothetical protein